MSLLNDLKRLAQIEKLNFVFSQGERVAVTQDKYLKIYIDSGGIINPGFAAQTVLLLTADPWVILASKLSPGNLVVRQWGLIDLYKGQASNCTKIQQMLTLVSYNNAIWAEGYSYWQYTKNVLNIYVQRFRNLTSIINIMNQIDQNFVQTAYLRGTTWYPAPFGDLTNTPLESRLQVSHKIQSKTVANVALKAVGSQITYTITGRPIGLNVHIPVNNYTVTIKNGIPTGYKFYTGYANKYPNKFAEAADVLNMKRIQSTFSLF